MNIRNEYYELLDDFTLVMKDTYCKISDYKQNKDSSIIEDKINEAEKIVDKIISLQLDDGVLMEKIKNKIIQPLEDIKIIWVDIKKETERKESNE